MPIPKDADRVLISVNPKSGRTSSMPRAEELRGRLDELGYAAEILTDLDEVGEKANVLHAESRLRALVGVGGDGTAAELINRTAPGTPFTILAAGNANLIAKYYRIGRTPRRLAEIIRDGHTITLDAGRANGRLFLVMVGCGFDAEVVKQVHSNREERYRSGSKKGGHVTNLSYLNPVWNSIMKYKYPKIKVETFENSFENPPDAVLENENWAFVFNLNTYGWGLPLVPAAKGNDGKLDHCLLRGGSVVAGGIYLAFAQLFSSHRVLPGVTLGQARKYRMTSESEVPYQLDGDPGGLLPLEIETVESRFTLIVPN